MDVQVRSNFSFCTRYMYEDEKNKRIIESVFDTNLTQFFGGRVSVLYPLVNIEYVTLNH